MVKKINFIEVYEDRIKQIESDISRSVHKKDWAQVTRLRTEQRKLREYMKELRGASK